MKKIFKIILLLSFNVLFSQSPVINIASPRDVFNVQGAYYKDVDNVLNNFEGTWVMNQTNSDGTQTYLKIMLRKVLMQFDSFEQSYSDELVGVYQYIDHGVEKVNTLSYFNETVLPWKFNITGNNILFSDSKPDCLDCTASEKRISLSYYESDRGYIGSQIICRRVVASTGQQAMKIRVMQYNNILTKDGDPPHQFSNMKVPFGVYELIKQP